MSFEQKKAPTNYTSNARRLPTDHSLALLLSLIMHVASPGLPESALRHLFYRVATQAPSQPSLFRPSSGRAAGGVESTASPRQRSGGGGRGGDGEPPPSTLRLARTVVEFPLACEGLAPLVEFTVTDLAARNLLKQVAHQAKQALNEAERVRSVWFFGGCNVKAMQTTTSRRVGEQGRCRAGASVQILKRQISPDDCTRWNKPLWLHLPRHPGAPFPPRQGEHTACGPSGPLEPKGPFLAACWSSGRKPASLTPPPSLASSTMNPKTLNRRYLIDENLPR